jgi:hypothetical protein
MNVKELRKDRTTRKGWVRKLDEIVSEIVRLRDKKSVTSGETEKLTCSHLFSRVAYSTRWDLLNCHAQTLSENFRHEYDPYPYTQWFIKEYGQEAYDNLHRQYVTPVQFKTWQLKVLYEQLKTVKQSLIQKDIVAKLNLAGI